MMLQNKIFALLTLVTTLTINDFPLIQNPNSKIPNSQVLAQTPADRKAEADRLFRQGNQQFDASQFEAALQSWQQALILYREIKSPYGEEKVLTRLGSIYEFRGQYQRALEYTLQWLAIAREYRNRQSEGEALGNLGNTYRGLGDYEKAIDYLQQSLLIARESHDRKQESIALGNIGSVYGSRKDYARAIDYLQQALKIAKEINDRSLEKFAQENLLRAKRKLLRPQAEQLSALGGEQYEANQWETALQFWQQALTLYREFDDHYSEAQTLNNIGNAYEALTDYAKAMDYYQQSLAIAQKINDQEGERNTLGNLANVYLFLGQYIKAIDYHQRSLAIARFLRTRQGNILGNQESGNYAIADARTFYRVNRRSEGIALARLAVAYNSSGEVGKSIEYAQQSLVIAREVNDPNLESIALSNLGLTYFDLGNYVKSINYLEKSLVISRKIHERRDEGKTLKNLGTIYYFLSEYSKAIEYYQQSLAIAREIQNPNDKGYALNDLGAALFKYGNLTAAEKNLFEGIQVQESIRAALGSNDANKVSIFENQARTYRTLQEVLIAQNKPDAALEIAERGRARAFVELLAKRITTTSDSANSPITPPTINQLQQIAKQQNATLVEYSIIYDNFKINAKQETHESELYIWVIKPTGEVTFRKADLKPLWQQQNTSLAELVTNSRKSIGVRNRNEPATVVVELSPQAQQRQLAQQRQKLQQLHQLLIEPIVNLLPTDPQARVIFIPQSDLFLVPFPALVDASGQYLIEKHTILSAPSIQLLELTRQQRQRLGNPKRQAGSGHPISNSEMLIVGNPFMPKVWNPQTGREEQLSYLAGAEREAQAVAKFFNAPVLLGKQATERAIKQRISNARIVHLATHGLLDYGTPEDTGVRDFPGAVALAPGEGEDGLLTSAEIVDMKLKAELVVLSACDTGRGRIRSEGVIGLSRSLISAGVPSVIVSLWAVDDAATTELMREFYKQWQQNPDKAQALRQAMLIAKQKHPDPRLWAAFTLIGEAE